MIKANKSLMLELTLIFLICFYVVNRIGIPIKNAGSVSSFVGVFREVSSNPFGISLNMRDLAVSVGLALLGCFLAAVKMGMNKKKFRVGLEYGSARWGAKEDIKPFIDKNKDNNIILTSTEQLTMNSRMKNPKHNKNKNVMVIGGSGSGKTRFYLKPNLMQRHSSYVITDPKGTALIECGKMLEKSGYDIKVINVKDSFSISSESMKYNPFAYIDSELDILTLVDVLIKNTSGQGKDSKEDFWIKAERLYYCALIGYIWYECPPEEQNFSTLLELVNASEARENDEEFKSAVDILFDQLKEEGSTIIKNGEEIHIPGDQHFAVRQYQKYKTAAGETAKSILISVAARLAPFDIQEIREFMDDDEMDFTSIGEKKTALFVIISDTSSTLNFIVSMLYTQLFDQLCRLADGKYKKHGGRLPVHVRFLLDEFANIGQIPDFEKKLATIRSREISATVILQSQAQLKALYKDDAEGIISNCDSYLFLGGTEDSTLKYISERLGKETIYVQTSGHSKGSHQSYTVNEQRMGRELMTKDELAKLDGGKCILFIRGVAPFVSDKFDITAHEQYKLLSDADPANIFEAEEYLQVTRKPMLLTQDTQFPAHEISDEETSEALAEEAV